MCYRLPFPPSQRVTFKCVIPLLFSPSQRVTFKYNGSTIVPGDQGVDYETFKRKCTGKRHLRCFGTPSCSSLPGARGERVGENPGNLDLVLLPPLPAPSRTTGFSAAKSIVRPVLCLILRLKVLWAFLPPPRPSLHNFSLLLGYKQDKNA